MISKSIGGDNKALSRRLFLLGTGTMAISAACSQNIVTSGSPSIDDLRYLKSGFADGLISPSTIIEGVPQRAPFLLYGSDGIPIVNDVPRLIPVTLQFPSGKSLELELKQFSEGIPTPYFPMFFESNEVGLHKVAYFIDETPQSLSFLVSGKGDVDLVQVGDSLRRTEIPTFDNPLGFSVICTRFDPCPYHYMTIEEALSNSLPTVLLVSTPGFCQTSICGPSLEILIELLGKNTDSLNVIHAEVYIDPEKIAEVNNFQSLLSPAVRDYGMSFEPSLIVANSENVVVSRLDYMFDKFEMENALSLIS